MGGGGGEASVILTTYQIEIKSVVFSITKYFCCGSCFFPLPVPRVIFGLNLRRLDPLKRGDLPWVHVHGNANGMVSEEG